MCRVSDLGLEPLFNGNSMVTETIYTLSALRPILSTHILEKIQDDISVFVNLTETEDPPSTH